MTDREKLYYLLTEYIAGRYPTQIFCDEFYSIFSLQINYDTLSAEEYELFSELSKTTDRYTPYEEDLKIPNAFFNEKDVKSKAEYVLSRLKNIKDK